MLSACRRRIIAIVLEWSLLSPRILRLDVDREAKPVIAGQPYVGRRRRRRADRTILIGTPIGWRISRLRCRPFRATLQVHGRPANRRGERERHCILGSNLMHADPATEAAPAAPNPSAAPETPLDASGRTDLGHAFLEIVLAMDGVAGPT